jgi:type II secretory pathway predicted ATPase ExeA
MSEQKREMSADEYVTMAKIDSLAKQNAGQALRIADLEAQLSLIQAQQQQQQQQLAEAPIPGEEPVFEEVDEAH